jgi:hypothetical protein
MCWAPLLTMCNKPRKDFIIFDTNKKEFKLVREEFLVDSISQPNYIYEDSDLNSFDYVDKLYQAYLFETGMQYEWKRMIKRITTHYAPNDNAVRQLIGPAYIIREEDVMDDDDILIEGYRQPSQLEVLLSQHRQKQSEKVLEENNRKVDDTKTTKSTKIVKRKATARNTRDNNKTFQNETESKPEPEPESLRNKAVEKGLISKRKELDGIKPPLHPDNKKPKVLQRLRQEKQSLEEDSVAASSLTSRDLSELMTRTISEQFKKSNDENKSFMLEVIHKNKSDIDEKFEMLNNKYARIEKELLITKTELRHCQVTVQSAQNFSLNRLSPYEAEQKNIDSNSEISSIYHEQTNSSTRRHDSRNHKREDFFKRMKDENETNDNYPKYHSELRESLHHQQQQRAISITKAKQIFYQSKARALMEEREFSRTERAFDECADSNFV